MIDAPVELVDTELDELVVASGEPRYRRQRSEEPSREEESQRLHAFIKKIQRLVFLALL